jgi:ABC-2 type transport system permease protein
MTVSNTEVPVSTIEGSRLFWTIRDSLTVTQRNLLHLISKPDEIVGGLAFPVIVVLLFGYVFGSAMAVPGDGNYREFLMPGLFVMTMAFGVGNTAMGVVLDTDRGVLDRFRVMPMSRSAFVAGRSLADMVLASFDLIMLISAGLVVGWRWNNGIVDALQAIGLLLLLRFSLVWAGIYLGLLIRSPQSAMQLFALVLPFTMVANTFVAPELMPAWLGIIAEWNPLSSTVLATRELFGNPGVGGDSWIARNAMLMAVVWPMMLIALFAPLAIRRYRNLSR